MLALDVPAAGPLEIAPLCAFQCQYCGAQGHLRLPGSGDARPVHPLAPPEAPPQRSSAALAVVALIVGLLLFLGVGFAVYLVAEQASPDAGQARPARPHSAASAVVAAAPPDPERLVWAGYEQPFLYDVTNSGNADVIGLVRLFNEEGYPAYLAAFEATTGSPLWRAGPLGTSEQMGNMRIALVGHTLLVADALGQLRAFAPRDGGTLWAVPLGERVKSICAGPEGAVELVTADERIVQVALATGALTPRGALPKNHECGRLWTTTPGMTPGLYVHRDLYWTGPRLPRIEGMDVSGAVRDEENGVAFALGKRSPGTGVPMVARFTPGPVRRRQKRSPRPAVAWQTVVPAGDILTVAEGVPETGFTAAGRLFVAYEMARREEGARLVALNTEDGARLWDVALPNPSTHSVRSIVADHEHVFVGYGPGLHIFRATDGAHVASIGR
jgi:hypothetical protein